MATMDPPNSQHTTPEPVLQPSLDSLDATDVNSRKRSLTATSAEPNLDAFLKQAHYGKLARELRARLSYASFKTSHNLSQVPFTSLETQFGASPRQSPSASQRQNILSPSTKHSKTQLMPPPASPAGQNLYSTLLSSAAMPPTKRARHSQSPSRGPHHRSRSSHFLDPNGTRNILNSRTELSPTEPDDINAAATLTSLLLNRPGSRSEGGSSLSRSSSVASVTAFSLSQPSSQPSQLSQTSSGLYRTHSATSTMTTSALAPPARLKTPQPDDAQAAELMLFLATSPSPSRSTHSRTRSEGRAGQLLSKGRVLFGGADSSSGILPSPKLLPGMSSSNSTRPDVSTPSSGRFLPTPPSPMSSKSSFDISQFINSSPSPKRTSSSTPRPPLRGEGRRLFGDDDDVVMVGGSPLRGRTQSTTLFPSANPSGVKSGGGMVSIPTPPVLGPPMGANG